MKKIIITVALILLILIILGGARKNRESININSEEQIAINQDTRVLTEKGGRIAWYKGSTHDLIAYDAIVNSRNKNTEVFTVRPDGTDKFCVTCDSDLPKGFIGQPAWHPNGEWLVVQAENEISEHNLYTHMSWGVNNDLWLVKRDGSEAVKIWDTPDGYAALHPHFNKDGSKILFAERVPTGKRIPLGRAFNTPGGENQWDGWRIHIADFDMNAKEKLSNHVTLFDNTGGMYETHEFYDDNTIVYSHTKNGEPYVDDIYMADTDGTNIRHIVVSPTTWDEHGSFHPQRREVMAFMSSRDFDWNIQNGDKATDLQTELYLKNINTGETRRISSANEILDGRAVVSDFDWNANGSEIAFQVASLDSDREPQIWIVEVDQNI